MRRPGRAPGRSTGLLFCGVALQILLVVLCVAASAADGVTVHSADSNLSDESHKTADDLMMVRYGAAERNVQTKFRDGETEEIIVEDNDSTRGTLPPAAGKRTQRTRG